MLYALCISFFLVGHHLVYLLVVSALAWKAYVLQMQTWIAYIALVPSTSYPRVYMIAFFYLLAVLGGDIGVRILGLDRRSVRFNLIERVREAVRHSG